MFLENEDTNTTTRKNERTLLGNLITSIDYTKVSHPRPSGKTFFSSKFCFRVKVCQNF